MDQGFVLFFTHFCTFFTLNDPKYGHFLNTFLRILSEVEHVVSNIFKKVKSIKIFVYLPFLVFECSQGKVSKAAFEEALQEAFPVKDEVNIAALLQAAVEELKVEGEEAVLEYSLLFTEVMYGVRKHT